ncbi:MAG: hypothetical protein A2W61_00695 [Deltaproteobacteria bacterium RIFCSPLOWO2_01_44_7]|nr:MAG: hypothetical protein A2712_05865 [Deltaproteobacteria bacterium RIFCSPHIGHO2_01_FULL_43_49]OGQ16657.1 MAG: hypothetical protein A3D22_06990 [Deltaproteobacteria bacterium RIFCSPHIGHO2_02_FULL_44_53]OGQ29795.1 MAG: hypothetical protein A3D98_09655 [Deltaproteobacteria bacterium RIFCSPHIGHO2_12_FULL_44_21]OGQ33085.1 MAG: hypothetical protein A2979_03635 [Deltaproteobacteria bacterium RIFCSPLOWO2_01_FULL_45_74]OGQ37925.1 MAG: hypothetical protein A2W61_00695 [Deltaproteobacteria bacterium 
MQNLSLQIANWRVLIHADFDKPLLKLPFAYEPFVPSHNQPTNWKLDIQYSPFPSLNGLELIYDTCESWTLFQKNKQLWYRRPSLAAGEAWGWLCLEKEELRGTIFLSKRGSYCRQVLPVFTHPLDQLLFFYWLSFYPALITHSCGVGVDDFGYAFLGHSGWGKTTLTRLFGKYSKHLRLSDDRLIIAKQEKNWRLFGTPWHGDAKVYSPASFPLKKIFFLKHGKQNEITPINPATAAAKVFAMSFPVLWNLSKRNHALDMASQIATDIPCYEFTFLPDGSAVDFLEKNLF